MKSKRGLSAIITSLIMILLVLVAVVIIWIVINNIIKGGTEGVALGKFTLDTEIKNVEINNVSNEVNLTVKRNPGQGEMSGIKFVFYNKTGSEVVTKENASLIELEPRKFNFHLAMDVDSLTKISIIPIIKSGEKEILGNVGDTYDVASGTSSGSGGSLEECSPATCESLGHECGSGYENGTCDGTLDCDTPGCGVHSTCSSGTCVCDSDWGDCNDNNSCDCDLTLNYCSEGNCVEETVWLADNCSQQAVQAAINLAVDGDIVQVPAGECEWTTWDSGRAAVRIIEKSITLKGSGIENTIITSNTDGGWGFVEPQVPLLIRLGEGKSVEISNFSFDQGDYADTFGTIYITGSGETFRFHDMKTFTSSATNLGRLMRITIGKVDNFLIDHNTFLHKAQVMWVDTRSYDGDGNCATSMGDDSFCSSYTSGSSEGIFVEDNVFSYVGPTNQVSRSIADVMGGARFIFRYNECTDAGIFTHGYETNGRLRGPRMMEVYKNTFHATYKNWNGPFVVAIRGGTAVITDNLIVDESGSANNYNYFVQLNIKRLEPTAVESGCESVCDGSQSCDGNGIPTGYPCRDQPGFGLDNGFETSQALEPIYIWGNTLNGVTVTEVSSLASEHIVENREYYLQEKPGYASYIYPHPLI